MEVKRTSRGFEVITLQGYPPTKENAEAKLLTASSAIGDYEDSFERPGSSFLWIGDGHHVNREEALEIGRRMVCWAATGSLKLEGE